MSLSEYRRKRDFKATPEPKAQAAKTKGNSFVIQKHAARRLHYDFRLEMNGVLKSWAVTRGPSLVPSEKRLAVHVEDHPLAYGDFEGVIPPGQYGSGEVIVWDRGNWEPLHDAAKGYRKGHLEFSLQGEKLHGHWHLVRMAKRDGETRENWLLIKGDDEFARSDTDPDVIEELPLSVKSGRPIESLKGDGKAEVWNSRKTKQAAKAKTPGKSKVAKAAETKARTTVKGTKPADLPNFVPPALATLVKTVPKGGRWLHEIKLDGYRIQARVDHGDVRLLTRTGLDWTDRFGDAISQGLKALPVQTALLDGEIVVETGNGSSDFSLLQADLSDGRADRFVYYIFDLVHLDGQDLTGASLIRRKAVLEHLMRPAEGPLKYSTHFDESGDLVLKHACRLSLEGVISKVADAPYRSGRGRDWVKSKCTARQELVIGGYVPSSVSDTAIGSLIMGVNDKDGLRHVGRVGTGYSASVARQLFRQLKPLVQKKSPFAGTLTSLERKDAVFVKPELVAEVEFRGWTGDAHLRHASFRGLRDDKTATEVVQESGPIPQRGSTAKPRARAEATAKRSVPLTHPDRLYWPEAGVTKEGLADYYVQVWPRIAPFIVDRPLALLRCPEGHAGTCFFQKHGWRGMRKEIITIRDPKDDDEQALIGIHDLDGLLALVQGAALEIHPWGSRGGDLERPDMVNIDLDPGPDVDWERVVAAAFEVRQRFSDMGLTGFVKTSGGKGLHVVAPVKPKAEWPAVKAAMKALADSMAADSPDDYVATISKAKRKGKILIDYLRNGRGNTAVAPYSTRAREGAPVSMPLSFDELGPNIGPNHYTVTNTPSRLEQQDGDPWGDFRKAEAPISTSIRKSRSKR
ncbi:DNA ligase D [Rhizobium sp. AG855]|uniref:DNA ligase D n=1 Tax=Rhizobium sp. AG855 TaxID=2183898 RepID=UPI000E71EFEE|nr:DNA ligase D [Rhizobium sp. AG855]RKE86224.1 ATP-dependent DNA ligase LigD phosphoesterase module /ATP-dependent DNA ligase LigD polymerase module [Rhizobium sp. AG855]